MVQSLDDARRRQSQSAGRVPPHNLDAEASLLGAMLLSKDAIATAMEMCEADDFYKPAHGHIFEAIATLYGRGEPADPVTVSDELSRAGLLQAIGGAAVLTELQANTPATSNAARYAKIIEEHALLRRLIGVANEVAELGYSLPDDVEQVIDQAESMMFQVAERRVADTLLPLQELLSKHLDHLEQLYDRGESITGTPTGYHDLDELLAGLQPSALITVGARPGMGKALALDTAIATPSGWSTMGELTAGDEVFDEQGRPCRVTYTSPVFVGHTCYEVRFDDGSSVVADADHRWFAYDYPAWKSHSARRRLLEAGPPDHPTLARDQSNRVREPRVVTTAEMVAEGVRVADGRPNWYLPLASLDPPDAELPVDPYVLGCWLGDGHTSGASMTIGENDHEHFVAEFEAAGYPLRPSNAPLGWATTPVRSKGRWQGHRGPSRVLARELQAVGLLGGARKHIPARYLRGSRKQRLALLQGIMDTDGFVTGSGVELCLADRELLAQVHELVVSLGHKPHPIRHMAIRLPDSRSTEAWRFFWTPLDAVFRLGRKAEAQAASCRTSPTGRPSRRAIVEIVEVPSVPTRCIAVDSPSHLFLAGRCMTPTHNTSFALGMAAHAAIEAQRPVLFFSLEMGHNEITQRLLAAEAKVESTKLRTGRLAESDWSKISHAIGRLSSSPLYIDDNPNLTVMEIRAKARRLQSKLGDLSLIVIDYLQLMTGRRTAENRQVEVSEMSRGLKILARELQVPVVALSQLSRNLEMRADKRPVLADLRESGCLTADSRVLRADTGAEVSLGELLITGERDIPVWSVDEQQRLVPSVMTHVFPSGTKEVFELRLASGRRVKASANHPFLRFDGWRRLDELEPGQRIAVPRRVPAPERSDRWPEAEVIMLAHLIGDGCVASGQPVHYTSADPTNRAAVIEAARHWAIEAREVPQGRWSHVYLPAPFPLARGRRNPLQAWLERFGLDGCRSHEKFVPADVSLLPLDQLLLFLRHLWSTDGCVWTNGRTVSIYYASSSRRLADDVAMLLLRLGIQTRIKQTRKDGHRPMWKVWVYGVEHQERFLHEVSGIGAKKAVVERCLGVLEGRRPNPNVDTIPVEVWDHIRGRLPEKGLTHRAFSAELGVAYAGSSRYRRSVGRPMLERIADVLEDKWLHALASSDLLWDEVVEVVPLGPQLVFDATVLGTHNFIADGVVVHNSIEQDSDVVMFIYRDEVYHAESPDRGSAEVIVSKHRNGPTGVTQLAFLDRYTRFANMAKV